MLKMGGLHKAWKLRWFVLEPGMLWYFKKPVEDKPQGCIELGDSVVRPANLGGGKEFCFELVTKTRIFLLIARNRSYMQSWMNDLRRETAHNRENTLLEGAERIIIKAEHHLSSSLQTSDWEDELSRRNSVVGWSTALRSASIEIEEEEEDESDSGLSSSSDDDIPAPSPRETAPK